MASSILVSAAARLFVCRLVCLVGCMFGYGLARAYGVCLHKQVCDAAGTWCVLAAMCCLCLPRILLCRRLTRLQFTPLCLVQPCNSLACPCQHAIPAAFFALPACVPQRRRASLITRSGCRRLWLMRSTPQSLTCGEQWRERMPRWVGVGSNDWHYFSTQQTTDLCTRLAAAGAWVGCGEMLMGSVVSME